LFGRVRQACRFWTFFGGTVLGKGFTLRPIQAAVLVALFSQRSANLLLFSFFFLFIYLCFFNVYWAGKVLK
jgi:hypothetical protein